MKVEELYRYNLNLLVAFCVLYEEKSVSKSADRLGLSQSGMSRVLYRTRCLLNDPLFYRKGSNLIPSQKSNLIYKQVFNTLIGIGNDVFELVLLHSSDKDK
ncbi:LysR family transcriptional regulator [Vibrio alginolyticus]|nr:LysR family transcriptional regulator [Vibrio alginolyticus]